MALSFLISLLGVPFGFIVGYIAREELVVGKKYFKMLSLLLFFAALLGLVYGIWTNEYILFYSLIFLTGIPIGSMLALPYFTKHKKAAK